MPTQAHTMKATMPLRPSFAAIYSADNGRVIGLEFDDQAQRDYVMNAVNSHAKLVEQLQAAVNYFDKHNIDGQDLHVPEMRAVLSEVGNA